MYNKSEFVLKVSEFIESDKRVALIKGYENEIKLLGVLKALNDSMLQNGTIHTRLMNNLNDLLLNTNIIKKTVKQQEKFKLSNLTLHADLYERNHHSNNDFAIYYPVQSALINAPDKLINHIKDNHSKKIFIVTTNDWHSDTSILDEVIDETIILDIRTFDQEQYDILFNNLKGNMPY